MRQAIKTEIKDSTVIIVAQRINIIMSVENILVLDQGKIVGQGIHEELLNARCMWKLPVHS